MQFDHPLQHGPETIAQLEALLRKPALKPSEILFLATELVGHGHRDAGRVIEKIQADYNSPSISHYCNEIYNCWEFIRNIYKLEDYDKDILSLSYRKNGFLIFNCDDQKKSMIVIFTTMFNNYFISSIALANILKPLFGKILILKDATRCNYFRGVEGFASDMPGISAEIYNLSKKLGIEKLYVSGFSSGGYAALLTSILLPSCDGYLGFSHMVDKSANSPLPQSMHMPEELRASFDQRWCRDLRYDLETANCNVPRKLIYGGLNQLDVTHANHLEGLNSIKLECLPNVEHNTILKLMANRQLYKVFEQMTAT